MRRAMKQTATAALLGLGFMALASCDLGPGDDMTPVPEAPTRSAEPAGEPVEVPSVAPDQLQEAASVDTVHRMPNQNAKVFGVAGGDPAINGVVTYLGLFTDPSEGWRVYRIGDFESWRVTEESTGRVVLDVQESRVDQATGQIVTEGRRLIVGFAREGETPPATITVTPAR